MLPEKQQTQEVFQIVKSLELKGARARKGLKQAEIAAMLGMKQTTYAAKENGRSKFSDKEKFDLSRALDLTPGQMDEFLYDGMLSEMIASLETNVSR